MRGTACREGKSAWPGSTGLLLLQLFTQLFPTSDHKHLVCTPVTLLLGYLLAMCPLCRQSDIAPALFAASLLQQMAMAGGRYAPEVTTVCETLLHSAVNPTHRVSRYAIVMLWTVQVFASCMVEKF